MAFNFWFEHVIDAYLLACAAGVDWKAACAEAERTHTGPVRVLTREDLAMSKGIRFGRQHIDRKVRDGTFPRPFQTPSRSRPSSKSCSPQRKKQKRKRTSAIDECTAE
jgi:hypothetical protein